MYNTVKGTFFSKMRKNIDPLLTKTLKLLGTSSLRPPTGAPPWTLLGDSVPQTPCQLTPQISKRGCAYGGTLCIYASRQPVVC